MDTAYYLVHSMGSGRGFEFEVTPGERQGTSLVRQTAIFDPLGLAGLAYWYRLYPTHQFVFAGMLRGIAKAAACETAVSGSA